MEFKRGVSVFLFLPLWLVVSSSVCSFEQAEGFGDWGKIIFNGEVAYTVVNDPLRGEVIRADSQGAASGLVVNKEVNLIHKPFLHWSWKLEKALESSEDEKTKSGDDFSVRVYVLAKGYFPWQTKAINYIWSRHYPVGESWDSPYTSNSKMVVVESGYQNQSVWLSYVRDVRSDFKTFFGKDIKVLHGVAIMSDTDNTGSSAIAYYGPYKIDEKR